MGCTWYIHANLNGETQCLLLGYSQVLWSRRSQSEGGHNHLHMNTTIVEKVFPNTPQYRLEREDYWIKTLNTKKPKGLNINN